MSVAKDLEESVENCLYKEFRPDRLLKMLLPHEGSPVGELFARVHRQSGLLSEPNATAAAARAQTAESVAHLEGTIARLRRLETLQAVLDSPAPAPSCEQVDATSGRSVRGGSWNSFARLTRASFRNGVEAEYRSCDVGFRLSRTP